MPATLTAKEAIRRAGHTPASIAKILHVCPELIRLYCRPGKFVPYDRALRICELIQTDPQIFLGGKCISTRGEVAPGLSACEAEGPTKLTVITGGAYRPANPVPQAQGRVSQPKNKAAARANG